MQVPRLFTYRSAFKNDMESYELENSHNNYILIE